MLYEAQVSKTRLAIRQENDETAGFQAYHDELDRLAGETRDAGQLLEPLADSVLDYTLRRLRPDVRADTRAGKELDETMRFGELSHMLSHPIASSTSLVGQSASAGNESTVRTLPLEKAWEQAEKETPPLRPGESYDWWLFALPNTQQPISSYDELFNLDSFD